MDEFFPDKVLDQLKALVAEQRKTNQLLEELLAETPGARLSRALKNRDAPQS